MAQVAFTSNHLYYNLFYNHFTITFSDTNDCRGTLWSGKDSGSSPPNNFDHKSQKAIMMFDSSEDGSAFPRWGQWT